MKRLIPLCGWLLGCLVGTADASVTDCSNVYIGRIWVEKGYGLFGVVFLNNASDASGSYWSYFNNWTADDKKSALVLLTTAKLSQHRVHVATEEPGGCGIDTGNRMIKSVTLANEP